MNDGMHIIHLHAYRQFQLMLPAQVVYSFSGSKPFSRQNQGSFRKPLQGNGRQFGQRVGTVHNKAEHGRKQRYGFQML